MRLALLLCCLGGLLTAEAPQTWPDGKAYAVSLTHDDGIESHIVNAAFALNLCGLKATFYPTGNSRSVSANPRAWAALAEQGHELGSHSMLHPCGESVGKAFLAPQDYLEAYTEQRMAQELDQSIGFLRGLGGASPKPLTHAWPCGQAWVGLEHTDVTPLAQARFVAARDAWGGLADPARVALMHVPAEDGARSLVSLKASVDEARRKGAWLVLMFHGVGGDYMSVDMGAYEGLLDLLAADPQAWVAPFGKVAARVRWYQEKH